MNQRTLSCANIGPKPSRILNPKYLYLTVNIVTLALPLAFSFHPKVNFFKKWKFVLPAILASAIVFIAWDVIFTMYEIWGFNEKYLTGYFVFNLPIEEVLFFICIPYACLFTHFAFTSLLERDYLFPHHELISSFMIIASLIIGIYFMDRAYTSVTFLLTGFFLSYHMLKVRPRYMGRFYFSYGALLVPFLIVNGILTGAFTHEPVVWYDNEENTGVRLFTIPVEDIFYGMMMMLIPIFFADELENRLEKVRSPLRTGQSIKKK